MIFALIATAAAAVTNWYSRWKKADRLELFSKPLTTVGAMAIAALAGGQGSATIVAVIALAMCLIGDIALLPTVDRFVVGLAAFLLGHIGFIVMFVLLGLDRWRLAGVAVAGCALLLGTAAVPILRGAAVKGFGLPVRFYFAVISSMCVVGWATGNWLIMIGATAFIVSDSILGWGEFVAERTWMHLAIMMTYHFAIVSLALSLTL